MELIPGSDLPVINFCLHFIHQTTQGWQEVPVACRWKIQVPAPSKGSPGWKPQPTTKGPPDRTSLEGPGNYNTLSHVSSPVEADR